jgi:putative tryptophan/tyrosine transport system substrate-binding protein
VQIGTLLRFIGVAVAASLALHGHAQPGKAARVAILSPGSANEVAAIQREPFERGLRELGWKPGIDVLIDYRYAEGSLSALVQLANELAAARFDVIVARGPSAIEAAQKATVTIPIVMAASNDPVSEGFARSMSRPGGNITGVATLVWELDRKRLELLKDTFPTIERVGVVANPNFDSPRFASRMVALRDNAQRLKLRLEVFPVSRKEDIDAAFAAINRSKVDALLVQADPHLLDHNRNQIAALAATQRLPAIYPWRFFAEAGGLMSYGSSIAGFHYRSANYVSRILRGAKPGELAVEQPTQFELVVNVAAANQQGIPLPKSLLFRADHLIQ